jgi:hypothetical protein
METLNLALKLKLPAQLIVLRVKVSRMDSKSIRILAARKTAELNMESASFQPSI